MSLGCSGRDFTECLTYALPIQDLDLLMHPLMEIKSQHLFPSTGASFPA